MQPDGVILTTNGAILMAVLVILTWIGSLVVFKTSTTKDIDKLKEREKEIIADVKHSVSKTDCEERRGDFSQSLLEIKSTVVRLEAKFDDYILNGRR